MLRRSVLVLALAPPACDAGSEDADAWSGVPDSAYCESVADWSDEWTELEEQILAIVNDVRSEGRACGGEGHVAPSGPLEMSPALRCAARKHSADMAARGYFEHDNPAGESPKQRIDAAGYGPQSTWGENIAAGLPDPEGTMKQWLDSAPHCTNIMNPGFTEIGVGYSPGGEYGHLWTQDFATPQ